jgi:excisionase family DNA binding protein
MKTATASSHPQPLMSYKQVAAFFGVKPRTIRTWTSRRYGSLPCIKVGAVVRFDPEDVHEFARKHRLERRVKTVDGTPADYLPPFVACEATWEKS